MKNISKKCPSLNNDLKIFEKALKIDIIRNKFAIPTNTKKYSKVKEVHSKHYNAYVCKRFRCMTSNKGAGGTPFRLTFIYNTEECVIYFVEFYFKGNKEKENVSLLKDVVQFLEKEFY